MNLGLRRTRREATRKPGPFLGEIPEKPGEPLKHVAFCAMGGGGSSTLMLRLQSYAAFVGRRPDNWFIPPRRFDRILEPGAFHISTYSHQSHPLVEQRRSKLFDLDGVLAGFHEQTGYGLDLSRSMDDNMLGYLHWMRGLNGAAVFWQLACFGFFSLHRIRDVVFLLRRPLDTWLSLTEPWRHRALFDEFGGHDSPAALGVFCTWWSSLALEYLWLQGACLGPVLIRYDRAGEDAKALPEALAAEFSEGSTWRPRYRDEREAPAHVREHIEGSTRQLQAAIWRD
jgi:hypothetical protein